MLYFVLISSYVSFYFEICSEINSFQFERSFQAEIPTLDLVSKELKKTALFYSAVGRVCFSLSVKREETLPKAENASEMLLS